MAKKLKRLALVAFKEGEMYEKKLQLDLGDFLFPIGKLYPENAWIKLAKMIPWEKIEIKYAQHFKNNGYQLLMQE